MISLSEIQIVTDNPVLVTGCTGFIGGHVISQLLAKGYKVRGTIRPVEINDNDTGELLSYEIPAKSTYEYLYKLPNAENNLEIVIADLIDRHKDTESINSRPKKLKSRIDIDNETTNTTEKIVTIDLNTTTDNNKDINNLWKIAEDNDDEDEEEEDLSLYLKTWMAAFDNVEYVIHIASPVLAKPSDPETLLIEPAVDGTYTILQMCKVTPSVKKLVLTSCIHALADNFINGKIYDESDWNSVSNLAKNSYSYSKSKAEFNAYQFMEQNDCTFTLTSILPGTVLGPHLGSKLSFSHRFLYMYLDGTNRGIANLWINISDVRDVAQCHLQAMESTWTQGRYICCNPAISHAEMLQIVHDYHNDMKVPVRKFRDPAVRLAMSMDYSGRGEYVLTHLGRNPTISIVKALQVGMVFRSPAQTILDTCRFFVDAKLIIPGQHSSAGFCTTM